MGSEWAPNGKKTLSKDTFRIRPSPDLSRLEEYTNIMHEYAVRLTECIDQDLLADLQQDFRKHDMEVSSVRADPTRITVTGYPPNDAFGNNVLMMVRKRDSAATMISSRQLIY